MVVWLGFSTSKVFQKVEDGKEDNPFEKKKPEFIPSS